MCKPDQFKPVAKALSALQDHSQEPLRFDITLDSGKEVSIMDREQYESLRNAAIELSTLKKQGRITTEPSMTDEDHALLARLMRVT